MIKGLLFDYGGTIDTNGLHWGGVLWDHYEKYQIPVERADFSKAYSFGERALAIHPLVKPDHTFYDVLKLKIDQQFKFLAENGYDMDPSFVEKLAYDCNLFAKETVLRAKPVLDALAGDYPMVMVSNFYGNLNTVLADFGIKHFFAEVVESAVVGVRKPDPAIYQLGVESLGFSANECVVVGDSYSKDIVPARAVGCKAIWLNVKGWEEQTGAMSEADVEINDFSLVRNEIKKLHATADTSWS